MTSITHKIIHILTGLLALVMCIFLVYAPILNTGRVWDDFFLIGVNPLFKSPVFVFEVFYHFLWMDQIAAYYRPVQNWSYILDYVLWGEWAGGYHLTSILVHALSGVLFWRLAVALLRDVDVDGRIGKFQVVELTGVAVALLWALHPAHNAAVAYISGRADPLACLFAFSGWLVFRGGDAALGRCTFVRWIISALLWLLALCSRETGVLWLVLFVAYEGGWRMGVERVRRMTLWVMGGVLGLLYAWLRHLPGAAVEKEAVSGAVWSEALLNTVQAFGDYLMLFFAPFYLSMERELVAEQESGMTLIVVAVLGVIFLAGLAWLPGKTRRLRRFTVAWFVGGFLAISPLVLSNATVAEHWMIFPFAGLSLGLVCLLLDVLLRRRWGWVLFGCWVVFLAGRTMIRTHDWVDQTTFLQYTLRHGEKSVRIAGVIASEAMQQGDIVQAETVARQAIADHENAALLEVYLASILHKQGKLKEALALVVMTQEEMIVASRRHPGFVGAPITRVGVLMDLGRHDEAVTVLADAVKIWPDRWRLITTACGVLQKTGHEDAARALLIQYVDSHPWHRKANTMLAVDYYHQGEIDEARQLLRKASRQDIHSPDALRILAALEARAGNFALAGELQKKALCRSDGAEEDRRALQAIEAARPND